MSTIAILGTLDSKGEEHAFLAELVKTHGHVPLLIDVGTGSDPTVVPDITRYQVAEVAGLRAGEVRGRCLEGSCNAQFVFG
jgi:uncharacterized protein (UPF0261 family)